MEFGTLHIGSQILTFAKAFNWYIEGTYCILLNVFLH